MTRQQADWISEHSDETYPKAVTPERFNRGSTMLTTTLSQVEWAGPVPICLDSRRFENLTVPRKIEG